MNGQTPGSATCSGLSKKYAFIRCSTSWQRKPGDGDNEKLTIHPLVHEWAKESLESEIKSQICLQSFWVILQSMDDCDLEAEADRQENPDALLRKMHRVYRDGLGDVTTPSIVCAQPLDSPQRENILAGHMHTTRPTTCPSWTSCVST
jgi:hypothetical protein